MRTLCWEVAERASDLLHPRRWHGVTGRQYPRLHRSHAWTDTCCRSARDFCAVSFGFFLVASAALLDLTTQVWVDPKESLALAILKSAGGGLAISTASAMGFCVAARLDS